MLVVTLLNITRDRVLIGAFFTASSPSSSMGHNRNSSVSVTGFTRQNSLSNKSSVENAIEGVLS